MTTLSITSPAFSDESKARELLESIRWPHGPACIHCGEAERVNRLQGKSTKPGTFKCYSCRKLFTVTTNTIFHGSHIPLNKWLAAIYMMASSKKGISANQLKRELGITYKSAWFLCHRIRECMKLEPLAGMLSGLVESDETYVGGKNRDGIGGRKVGRKAIVQTLIERQSGDAHSFAVERVNATTLQGNIASCVAPDTVILTDEWAAYRGLADKFAGHETVNHGRKEYVRGIVHVNFAESYFSLLKRGVIGAFHHVSKRHMPRYLAEFDRRWNTRKWDDGDRALDIIRSAEGRRLMYRAPVTH